MISASEADRLLLGLSYAMGEGLTTHAPASLFSGSWVRQRTAASKLQAQARVEKPSEKSDIHVLRYSIGSKQVGAPTFAASSRHERATVRSVG
jgi:hypothetical protein